MIEFKKSNILDTHLNNGALQGLYVYKKNNLELLQGYKTINQVEIYFNKGWYDKKLNFISECNEIDQMIIDNILVF